MIPVVLIVSAIIGAAAAGGMTAFFWEDIKQFLKGTLDDIRRLTSKFIHGCKVFLRRIKNGLSRMVKIMVKYYIKNNNCWEQISYHQILDENEVPLELLEQSSYEEELDISKQTQLILRE